MKATTNDFLGAIADLLTIMGKSQQMLSILSSEMDKVKITKDKMNKPT